MKAEVTNKLMRRCSTLLVIRKMQSETAITHTRMENLKDLLISLCSQNGELGHL